MLQRIIRPPNQLRPRTDRRGKNGRETGGTHADGVRGGPVSGPPRDAVRSTWRGPLACATSKVERRRADAATAAVRRDRRARRGPVGGEGRRGPRGAGAADGLRALRPVGLLALREGDLPDRHPAGGGG